MPEAKSVYRVTPNVPVFGSPYYAVASDFGHAERMVLAIENRGELDCQGIKSIERVCAHFPHDPELNQFVGF